MFDINWTPAVDYQKLTPGYIRQQCRINVGDTPDDVVDLCTKFVKVVRYEKEADDPVNFISDDDIEKCVRYKAEGNKYFKVKEYSNAIIKYNTALQYNPNNHLVWSNKAFCHYLLGDNQRAWHSIYQCLEYEPAFCKGWYRCSLIFEKFGSTQNAAVASKTAWQLSKQQLQSDATSKQSKQMMLRCKSRYLDFMKLDGISAHITNYEKSLVEDVVRRDALLEEMGMKYPLIGQLLEKLKQNDDDESYNDLEKELHNGTYREVEHYNQNKEFRLRIEHAQYQHFVDANILQFGESELGYDRWVLRWRSQRTIAHNKRVFEVNILARSLSGDGVVHETFIHGQPTAQQVIRILYQAMKCCNQDPDRMKDRKPRLISVTRRFKSEFRKIKAALLNLDIECSLLSKDQQLAYCIVNGNDPSGYEHLKQRE